MQRHLALACILIPGLLLAFAQVASGAPGLSEPQVRKIIEGQRKSRTDLPEAFPKFRSTLRKEGNYYTYIEYGLPESPEYNHIFKLNQKGILVDVLVPGHPEQTLKCPDKVYTEKELAEIIQKERQKRSDLPAPFPASRTRMLRMRCLYLYFEYAVPESRGNFQVFTIDPFGELMEFSRSQPY